MGEPYRVNQRGVVGRAPRDVDGLGGQRQAFVEIGVVVALAAQQREQASAVGTIRVAEPGERA